MYSDNTLTPKEAVRLCALGILSGEPLTYGALAQSVRHFVDRIQGPSLDVLGTSVELLKYEGLVDVVEENGDQEILKVTDKGKTELHALLTANSRAMRPAAASDPPAQFRRTARLAFCRSPR